ncbi:hypothetical protein TNCT_341461 [Trichonephila clavata]|uniref:Uncharacterized protein n=1 Tax=Trichonephila clavata TaxID=2740835 RepID=A0A8X6EZC6_TRICU|nr:hypothetical protein TNCT_341461 [Trichonephila clavata]
MVYYHWAAWTIKAVSRSFEGLFWMMVKTNVSSPARERMERKKLCYRSQAIQEANEEKGNGRETHSNPNIHPA